MNDDPNWWCADPRYEWLCEGDEMSAQVVHALKQAGIMIALAVLGVVVNQYTGILAAAEVNPLYYPIIGAVLAGLVRGFEGLRDGHRDKEGVMLPADVGFEEVKDLAENTPSWEFPFVADRGKKIYV